jgi:hypothetical protein
LPTGSEAIAPADDGWGPYKPILAVKGDELIPGLLATGKNIAAYLEHGKGVETHNYKVVMGTILAKGVMPSEADAVGFVTNSQGP